MDITFVFIKIYRHMDSLEKIDSQIEAAKKKRKEIILLALDGRTQSHISDKTGINETKLSKWINGLGGLEDSEINNLEKYLGVDLK